MIIIYRTDCACIQKRIVATEKGTAQRACRTSKGLFSYSRKREEPLDALDEDDCLGRWWLYKISLNNIDKFRIWFSLLIVIDLSP